MVDSTAEPHNCDDGRVFNFGTRTYEPCPICLTERRETVKENELTGESQLESELGFGERLLNKEYEFESVMGNAEKFYIEQESMENLEEALDSLYGKIVNGERIDESVCFGLGIKGNVERVAYPFMVKAYETGYTVHRILTALEYNRLVNREDPEVEELLTKDIVVVWINDGCSSREIDSVKGLMQTRAIRGKGTILLTTWLIEACSGLLYAYGEPIQGLAKPVFVKYKSSGGTGGTQNESSYIQSR